MEEMKGLKTLQTILEAQKSRWWTAHNELDYFTLCPGCGHWFDYRNPESTIKHRHTMTASIVVTTIMPSGGQLGDPTIHPQKQTSPSSVTIASPGVRPETGEAKS